MDGSTRLLSVFVLTSTSAICMQALLLVDNNVSTRMLSDGLVVLTGMIFHVFDMIIATITRAFLCVHCLLA
jgi:hypothetical protein